MNFRGPTRGFEHCFRLANRVPIVSAIAMSTLAPRPIQPDDGGIGPSWDPLSLGQLSQSPLRFGIMMESRFLETWQLSCLNAIVRSGLARPEIIILRSHEDSAPSRSIAFKNLFYYALRFTTLMSPVFRKQKLPASFDMVEVLECKTKKKGTASEFFEEADIHAVREKNLDFILKFGFGILKGDLLSSARYGIWSFHHGDERDFRGRPAGFWEMFQSSPSSGVILQKITEKLDAGVILKRANFGTNLRSYRKQLQRLYEGCTIFPLLVCRDILLKNAKYFDDAPSATKAPAYSLPSNFQVLRLVVRSCFAQCQHLFYGLFQVRIWALGIYRGDLTSFLKKGSESHVQWIEPKNKKIYADPFISMQPTPTIFFEEMDYRDVQGRISRIDIDGASPPTPVLSEESRHLSYPSVFNYQNKLYCLPEQAEGGAPILYSWNGEKQKFEKLFPLIENAVAVDPSLFFHENLWWLSYTESRLGKYSHLMLWFAETPFDKFRPHPLNPVKIDSRSSRGAGNWFRSGADLFRPTQNCAVTYGASINLNRVIELTPSRFEEVVHQEINPISPRWPDGFHHLSIEGEHIAFDSCRIIFDPLAWFYRVKILARTLRNKPHHPRAALF